mgnify:CR=1 FL=1
MTEYAYKVEENAEKEKAEAAKKSKVDEAKKKADEFCELEMSKATGGVPLPFDMKSFL